jgi:hypothetical protein
VVLRSELFFFVRMQLIVMFRQHLIELIGCSFVAGYHRYRSVDEHERARTSSNVRQTTARTPADLYLSIQLSGPAGGARRPVP